MSKPCGKDTFRLRPDGDYLCGYCIGEWEKLPALYRRMLNYAFEQDLELTGDCYETGLNEFAISDLGDYVTQSAVKIR